MRARPRGLLRPRARQTLAQVRKPGPVFVPSIFIADDVTLVAVVKADILATLTELIEHDSETEFSVRREDWGLLIDTP